MHRRNLIGRWIVGGLVIAGAGAPMVAHAGVAGPAHGLLPARVAAVRAIHHGRSKKSAFRVARQIRLVASGQWGVSALGPSAVRIYEDGGISTAEPDAQAVEQARSGSLLTGRAGNWVGAATCVHPAKRQPHASTCDQRAPARVSFCAPTATVCNTLVPGPAGAAAQTTVREKRAAARVTASKADAMQAAAVARGEANSVLSNPYIEQKVTAAESVGANRTKVPAGGF